MDATLASLAGYIISELAPYFSGFAKDMTREAVSKLYEHIKAKFSQKSNTETLGKLESNPNSQDAQEDARYFLEKYLRDDAMFARAISELVKGYHSGATMTAGFKIGGNQEYSPNIVSENVHIYYHTPATEPTQATKKNDEINVFLKSERFKKVLEFTVKKDIRVSDFLDLLLKKWNFPQVKTLPDIMFTFNFGYSLSQGDKGLPDLKFSDLGITDGSQIELGIITQVLDEIEKIEYEEVDLSHITYDQARVNELIRRDKVKRARGRLDNERLDVLINSCFSHVDK
jgi:hypothetical protein